MMELTTWVGNSGDTTVKGGGNPSISSISPIIANSKYYNSNFCDCYGYYYADNRSVLLYVCVGCNDDRGWSLPFISGPVFFYYTEGALDNCYLDRLNTEEGASR
jgi:hypothetical protein